MCFASAWCGRSSVSCAQSPPPPPFFFSLKPTPFVVVVVVVVIAASLCGLQLPALCGFLSGECLADLKQHLGVPDDAPTGTPDARRRRQLLTQLLQLVPPSKFLWYCLSWFPWFCFVLFVLLPPLTPPCATVACCLLFAGSFLQRLRRDPANRRPLCSCQPAIPTNTKGTALPVAFVVMRHMMTLSVGTSHVMDAIPVIVQQLQRNADERTFVQPPPLKVQ